MDLVRALRDTHTLRDLPRLVQALGHEPAWERIPAPSGAMVVGRTGEVPWLGLEQPDIRRAARALARRWASRGRLAAVLGLEPGAGRVAIAFAVEDSPSLLLDRVAPDPVALRCLERVRGPVQGSLAWMVRAAEALRGQSAGGRFFHQFRDTLERMASRLPGPLRAEDRRGYALLQLTRVLFLYFVQAKGWLAGRERFLAEEVDRCLMRRRRIHRDLLRPLFFGTLNRPAAERSRAAAGFGAVPFLNGGLFEPHPLERRIRLDLPNDVWRDAFDGVFERFHFTVAEGGDDGRIAPDMLGRVFEGLMAPDARRASGTYYTPAALVRDVLDAALAGWLSHRAGCSEPEAERKLARGDPAAWAALEHVTVLDPAVGSGAFLLGALERLAALAPTGDGPAIRRAILQRNLFGVDRSAGAVRLTELRLWLAVIAPDPAERPERVLPLPNLDCLVRQGDSLFEPVAAGLRLPAAASALAADLARARPQVVTASGPEKRVALRRLAELELRAALTALEAVERERSAAITECLRDARTGDLFGVRRGLDGELRARLAGLRSELQGARRARRVLVREREVPWFHYQLHFADVFARGGFDLVVGNPPWIRAEELPPDERRRLAGRYRWWVAGGRGYANRPDVAVAFLQRALELTAKDGVVALLLPAKLATAGYGAAARHGLATEVTLLRVADLSGRAETAFEATVYPLALVTRKSRPVLRHRVATGLGTASGLTVAQRRLGGGGPWVLAREPLREALALLAGEHPALDSIFPCQLGLKTGANSVFLRPPDDVEPEVLREAVRGRDVRAFRVEPRSLLLYTHGRDGRPRATLPSRASAYLARHEDALRARADYAGGPTWTLFRTGAATAPYRVIWADLARRLTAAPLAGRRDERLVPLNTCYVARVRSVAEADRVAAWLNASWLRAAARAGAVPAASGYARFTATAVGRLPLPAGALSCPVLPELAAAGRRGEPVQDDLDDVTAGHLALPVRTRSALRRFLAGSADDRR